MKRRIKFTTMSLVRALFFTSLTIMIAFPSVISANPVFRFGIAASEPGLHAIVNTFLSDLGGNDNGVGGSFKTGFRSIDWDGVPDGSAAPNVLPANFFNVNSPRGVVFNTINESGGSNQFFVSASETSGTAVRFGNIQAAYSGIFTTFTAQRLFTVRNASQMEITFFIPGTKIPATVSGFGAVFCDVDSQLATDNTSIRYYAADGSQIAATIAPASNNGLSFVGVTFNAGERVARVIIELGTDPLSAGAVDGVSGVDVVVMDDFIYGEPRALEYHPSDFDGDGTADFSVFRPSTGQWFVLNSGDGSFTSTPFGQNGDIPVEGDFDGDSRSDIAVFRPSNGTWFMLKSSNGQFTSTQFGQNGDRPVPGDYDKDRKTDISVFRPSTGQWFYLRSSDGQFVATQWGQNLDIPLPASAQ